MRKRSKQKNDQNNFYRILPGLFFVSFLVTGFELALISLETATSKNAPYIIMGSGFIIGVIVFYIINILIKQKNLIAILQANEDINKLLETQKNLEQKIEDRTKEYKNQKIMAENAARAKEEFLADMSHELRTPLNSIIGLTKIIAEDNDLTPDQEEMIGIINKASDNLLKTVNDILDISKIEAGKTTLEKKPFDLSESLHSIVDQIKPLASQRGLNLEDNLSNLSNIYIESDEHRITKIITNLASNAVKYTEEGHVRLEFETNTHDNITEFTCRVSDTGIGIPKDTIEHIFDKFSQAQETSPSKFGSSGLGLNITKQLVDLMLGSIEVDSELGKGSTFTVTLPCRPSTKEKVQKYKQRHTTSKKSLPSLHNVNFLIAEDHEFNKVLIQKLLSRANCTTFDIVSNGNLAIQAFQAKEYDMVLMDCNMPELNGYDAAKNIRRIESISQTSSPIPIIAMTADVMPGVRNKCINSGMNDYISKPIHEDIFHEIVHKWLGNVHTSTPHFPKHNDNTNSKIDLSLIQEYADYNFETQKELIQIFYQKSLKDLQAINENIVDGESKEWIESAHALKGSAGYIGAKKLEYLCDTAQSMDISTKRSRQAIYRKIEQEHASVCKFLRNEKLL